MTRIAKVPEEANPMTTATRTRLMTATDLLDMPDDGWRYELIRGELIQMSPAGNRHGKFAMRVSTPLDNHVDDNDLGEVYAAETGYFLSFDPDTVRAPDVSFISRERLDAIGETDGYWPAAPDLAVEVISPNDRYSEVEAKVRDWLDAGTRMVIVVNPRTRTVRVYRSPSDVVDLTVDDVIDGADVVPGWRLPVSRIFR